MAGRLAAPEAAPEALEHVVISRLFDAPRGLVWQAWTEAERLARWWGPKGFAWARGMMDLRPGGTFHYGLTAPDGKTTLTLEGWPLHASEAERKAFEGGIGSMEKGFAGTLEQLAGYLAGEVAK